MTITSSIKRRPSRLKSKPPLQTNSKHTTHTAMKLQINRKTQSHSAFHRLTPGSSNQQLNPPPLLLSSPEVMFLGLSLKHNDLLPHSRGNAGQILASHPEQDAMPSCWSLRGENGASSRVRGIVVLYGEVPRPEKKVIPRSILTTDLRFTLLRRF